MQRERKLFEAGKAVLEEMRSLEDKYGFYVLEEGEQDEILSRLAVLRHKLTQLADTLNDEPWYAEQLRFYWDAVIMMVDGLYNRLGDWPGEALDPMIAMFDKLIEMEPA